MHLIFVYGPPAAGKLTISKGLARKTGYRLFHNQLIVDFLLSVFDWGTKNYYNLWKKIYFMMLKMAIDENIKGMIVTFCYSHPHDLSLVKKIYKIISEGKGKIDFVRIECTEKELLRRVKNKSRTNHKKIRSKMLLKKVLKTWNLNQDIPLKKGITINSSILNPRESVDKILSELKSKKNNN